jgi:small subunit ribosomal protein S20
MKHAIKSLEEAIVSQNPELAMSRLREAASVIDKTASHGVIHRNLASRKISRLTSRVNSLAPSA